MTQAPFPPAGTPTFELGCAEHLDKIPVPVIRDGVQTQLEALAVVRVGMNLAELVDEHGAVIACRLLGGLRVTWQAQGRLAIEVFARTYTEAWATQAGIDALLADRYRPARGSLRIDSWRNESAAAEQPYPNGDLTVISSIWRVTTRQLPA